MKISNTKPKIIQADIGPEFKGDLVNGQKKRKLI